MNNNYFRYLNQKCPVCGKEFTGEDDIVVCPLCGTPHHRDCYKKNGECGNFDKHNEGFRWAPEAVNVPPVEPTSEQLPETSQNPVNNSQSAPFSNGVNPLSLYPQDMEEDVKTEEVAGFVQLGAFKYIQNFFYLKSKRSSFNWAAFLFAPYWFFYRKLYKVGAICLAIMLASTVLLSIPSAADKISEDLYDFAEQYQSVEAPDTAQEQQDLMNRYKSDFVTIFKNNIPGTALLLTQLGVLLGIHLFAGFKANKLYYNHTIKIIRKIKKETPDEAKRRLLFFKSGGVSASITLLSILGYDLIIMAISYLFQFIK